eukprot:2507251-Heterocapsa_arctica.AAC.1
MEQSNIKRMLGQPFEPDVGNIARYQITLSALGMDAVIICAHVALPVRSFLIVWVELVFIVGYLLFVATYPGDVAENFDPKVITLYLAII